MKLFFLLLALQGLSGSPAFKRMCPTCVDRSYITFYYHNFHLFHNYHIPYPKGVGQCKNNDFKEMECYNSCMRVQIREKHYDNSYLTFGWMYGCSTGAIQSTAPWLFLQSGLDNFHGNLSYVFQLTMSQSYEVTFYENGSYVEKPEEYAFRMSGLSREVYEILKRIKSPKMADVPFIFIGFLIIGYIGYIFCWVQVKCENCCFKYQQKRRLARTMEEDARRRMNEMPLEPRFATIKRRSLLPTSIENLLPIPVEIPTVPKVIGTANMDDIELGTASTDDSKVEVGYASIDDMEDETTDSDDIKHGITNSDDIEVGTVTIDEIEVRTENADDIELGTENAVDIDVGTMNTDKIGVECVNTGDNIVGTLNTDDIEVGYAKTFHIAVGNDNSDDIKVGAANTDDIKPGTAKNDDIKVTDV